MKIARQAGDAPRTKDLARQIDTLSHPCVGCTDCQGVCEALIDALVLPGMIIKSRSKDAPRLRPV